jgi:YidC/Oxa1 family membrane protein insertase
MAKPLFLVLHWTHDNLISNWGWAIVFVTVIINLLMIPLRFSNLRSMQKMQAIKPEIDKINEKYKKVAMRDPRRQEQNQEIMALYQKHGVSPVGGCLPMLLQMPFFIAFYTVLTVVIEMRGANWLWVPDLSQPEPMFIRILPLAMIATQFVMQKMTPSTPGVDPTQQRMMMFMPLIFGVMFYAASSGLVLYWLTGNVVGIVQQYFFNRVANKPAPAAAARRKS